ncbi:MAG: glycosyltransferase family 39 protein, partial [Nitrososphaerales archaeon]
MHGAPSVLDATRAPAARVAPRAPEGRRRFAVGVIAVALAAGIALRAWFLFHDPLTSDEAVVGLIAREILHGHTNAFVWTQTVGGVEPYAVAGSFLVFGQGSLGLLAAPVVLSIASALLVWRVALRLVRDPLVAALAGALSWAAPLPAVYLSTVEGGYRGVTLLCGLTVLLFALRILDGQKAYWEWLALGLAAGVGWWALPEIVYFLLPAGLVVVGGLVSARAEWPPARWIRRLGVGISG